MCMEGGLNKCSRKACHILGIGLSVLTWELTLQYRCLLEHASVAAISKRARRPHSVRSAFSD